MKTWPQWIEVSRLRAAPYGVDTAAPLKYNAVGTPIADPAKRAADWTEACSVVIR